MRSYGQHRVRIVDQLNQTSKRHDPAVMPPFGLFHCGHGELRLCMGDSDVLVYIGLYGAG